MKKQISRWEVDTRNIDEVWAKLDFTKDGHVDFREWSDWAA